MKKTFQLVNEQGEEITDKHFASIDEAIEYKRKHHKNERVFVNEIWEIL